MPFVTKETTNVNLRLIYQQSFLRTELILGGGGGDDMLEHYFVTNTELIFFLSTIVSSLRS